MGGRGIGASVGPDRPADQGGNVLEQEGQASWDSQLHHIRQRLHEHQERLDGHDGELAAIGDELTRLAGLIDHPSPGTGGGTGLVAIVIQPQKRPDMTYSTGGSLMASVDVRDDQEVTFTLAEEDAYGNPVTNGPAPAWQVSDAALLKISNMSADGLQATVQPVGPTGTATVDLSVDVPQADGTTQTLSGSFDINVTAGPASQLVVTPGAPEAKGSSTLPPVA